MGHEVETMVSIAADNQADYGMDVPWHGLGTVVHKENGEGMHAAEAMELAGLDWEVEKRPCYVDVRNAPEDPMNDSPVYDSNGRMLNRANMVEVPDTYITTRMSDNQPLGTVGERYEILQNTESFDLVDSLIDQGQAYIRSAGSLRTGRNVWVTMQIPDDIRIAGMEDERIEKYFLLSNSHDGSSSVTMAVTPIRVVCKNTEAFAIEKAQRKVNIRHTKNMMQKMSEARRIFGIAQAYYAKLEGIGNEMVQSAFTDDDFQKLLENLIPYPDDETNLRGITRAENRYYSFQQTFKHAPNLQNIQNTKWAALQAVIEQSDHNSEVRTQKVSAADTRMSRIVSGAPIVQKAFDYLMVV